MHGSTKNKPKDKISLSESNVRHISLLPFHSYPIKSYSLILLNPTETSVSIYFRLIILSYSCVVDKRRKFCDIKDFEETFHFLPFSWVDY